MYMRRRDAACTLLARCALLALCARNVASSILAASQLENCISTSGTGGSTTCRPRFVLTLSVQNGQDSTESMTAYRMQQARDAEGNVYDILDEVEITLVKSQISLHYPLLYQRNYNNKPTELVRTRDTTGRGFNWLTNPCVDDADKTGACGWMLDSAGQKIPSSNGFCCRCDFSDFVSGNAPAGSRGNLHCELFDSVDSQSAHCLRMDPLAYSAFTLQPHRVFYDVAVVFQRCRPNSTTAGNNNTAPARDCTANVEHIGPQQPGACTMFAPFRNEVRNASSSASSASTDCDARVSLEGDFAAFESAPDFSDKYLLAPMICTDFDACSERVIESSDYWLMVDRSMFTTGSDCDKIGVSYAAFQTQGQRCNVAAGSCLRYQPQHLYEADRAAEAQGRTGSYFLKYFRQGDDVYARMTSQRDAEVIFYTNRFQRSVLTVTIDADRVAYTLRVSPGRILAASIASFEAMSRSGVLEVALANVGDVSTLYTLTVHCDAGVSPIVARQVTLGAPPAANSMATLSIPIYTTSMSAATYNCSLVLQDSMFRHTDNRSVSFNTTRTVQQYGEQGGSPAPGAPSVDARSTSNSTSTPCKERCGTFDLLCALSTRCVSLLGAWAGSGVAALLLAGIALKYPALLCAPCKLVGAPLASALTSASFPSTSDSDDDSHRKRRPGTGQATRGHSRSPTLARSRTAEDQPGAHTKPESPGRSRAARARAMSARGSVKRGRAGSKSDGRQRAYIAHGSDTDPCSQSEDDDTTSNARRGVGAHRWQRGDRNAQRPSANSSSDAGSRSSSSSSTSSHSHCSRSSRSVDSWTGGSSDSSSSSSSNEGEPATARSWWRAEASASGGGRAGATTPASPARAFAHSGKLPRTPPRAHPFVYGTSYAQQNPLHVHRSPGSRPRSEFSPTSEAAASTAVVVRLPPVQGHPAFARR